MILLGQVNSRQILYTNIRSNSNWVDELPNDDWIAFTITDNADEFLVDTVVKTCINRHVGYTCSAGALAYYVENAFDIEFVDRTIALEEIGEAYDPDACTLMTSAHNNFSEGFWFAATLAHSEPKTFDKVVCLDFTVRGVQKQIEKLTLLINNGWLPPDEEYESPIYDQ